ncbi:transposase [Streptomyces sp. NPDC001523]|uniref:transposase n=1 Tax=Streptomyces sp. NPDC001523 TaxID=3154383 RepID=UPI0033213F10
MMATQATRRAAPAPVSAAPIAGTVRGCRYASSRVRRGTARRPGPSPGGADTTDVPFGWHANTGRSGTRTPVARSATQRRARHGGLMGDERGREGAAGRSAGDCAAVGAGGSTADGFDADVRRVEVIVTVWVTGALQLEAEPVKYRISNLPTGIPAKDLVRLAETRRRIEHDYRELKTALGLDHFEGRSFTGSHRHVTLVTAAHPFLIEQRRTPKAPARA